ncbi:MAG: ABC transporter ATP-binding protein [Negativibacillus sp.]
MLKTLLPYVKKYKMFAILTPLCIVGEVLLETRIPLLMSNIVDIGIANQDIGYVVKIGLTMMLMALCSLFFGAMAAATGAKAGMGFAAELRQGMFNHIQDFSFANVDKFSTSSLVTRLTTDVNRVQMAFMMCLRVLVRAPVMLVMATFMAYRINSELVFVFLVAIPILAIAMAAIATTTYPRFMAMMKKFDTMNGTVQENLVAIRVVKAFVRGKHEIEKFDSALDELQDYSIRAEKVMAFGAPVMQLTVYGCMIAILWFGGNQIIVGTMQTGELMGFISYVTQILMSLMMIAMIFINLVMSRASIQRITEVLNEKIDINDDQVSEDVPVKDGSIVFENVSFSYNKNPDNKVLDNINLEIQSGETIGIIGGTGSAKTTLVQLIPRLYDVLDGRILVGGRDVRDYKLETLRNAVGMVLQKNVLFSGSINSNLRWGDSDASVEEIREACRAAQADDFVTSFPQGYETDLGQGGVNVSGGQKQRLCIARALLKKPKIIILDDSTSAVDTATDAKIRQAFRENLKGTTTIIIAQRISSVSDADKIIVLDDGRIDGIGTHEELIANNRIYREVYESQQEGAKE